MKNIEKSTFKKNLILVSIGIKFIKYFRVTIYIKKQTFSFNNIYQYVNSLLFEQNIVSDFL